MMSMKQILTLSKAILVLAFLFSASQAFSTIRTVSNNTAISAQYSSVAAAITAASPGDTIYIHGSNTAYGDVTLNKRLILIGPGYGPSNPTGYAAQIGTLNLDTATGPHTGASGSYIAGLYMSSLAVTYNYYNNGNAVSNITIRRNQFTSTLNIGYSNTLIHNWLIQENLIQYLSFSINTSSSTGILINNNIIGSNYYTAYNAIYSNDVFYNVPTFNACTVQNCIFVTSAGTNASVNSIFNNNLFSSAVTFGGSNTISGTLAAGDPQFIGGTGTSYLSISNYKITPLTTASNAGTDGKDLGVYGGTGFLWGGTPPVPMVYFYNLKPNYVLSTGTLNVTVSVKNQ
jgi:hypothetical protein